MDDKFLYLHLPEIEDAFIKKEEERMDVEHVFSEKFEEELENKIKEEGFGRTKYKQKSVMKAAVIVLAVLSVCGGAGTVVNAATGGSIARFVKEICFGQAEGSSSQFYYGSGDSLKLEDFPQGTVAATVYYSGDGEYLLADGTKVDVGRLIFLDATNPLSAGDEISVFILPE